MNFEALPELFAQVGVEARSSHHFADILLDAHAVSDLKVIAGQTASDQAAKVQLFNQVETDFDQFPTDALAAIFRKDNRVHSIQPFASRIMRGQSTIVSDFSPGFGRVVIQVNIQAHIGGRADDGLGVQRHELAFGE